MLIGMLFDYDNNDLGTLSPYDSTQSTKGIVFLNGYLSAAGYTFSSPDHFDVNDVLPSQIPLLEQIAGAMGQDAAFYNPDVSLPRQYWSLVYDSFTSPGLPNFIPNVPPSIVDPAFTIRTRSLVLSVQNPVRPTALGLMDTYSSVVSANLHLQNGVTGSVFLIKKPIATWPPSAATPPARPRSSACPQSTTSSSFRAPLHHVRTGPSNSSTRATPCASLTTAPERETRFQLLCRLRRQLQRAVYLCPVFGVRRRH